MPPNPNLDPNLDPNWKELYLKRLNAYPDGTDPGSLSALREAHMARKRKLAAEAAEKERRRLEEMRAAKNPKEAPTLTLILILNSTEEAWL